MPDSAVILIADDVQVVADMIGAMVTDLGCTALVAYNGRDAVVQARIIWPAVVITDLMMPIMDGRELVRTLRDDQKIRGEEMPAVILISASSDTDAEEVGADAFLAKPFGLDELAAVLQRYLDR